MNTHLSFCLTLFFLVVLQESKTKLSKCISLIMVFGAIISTLYVQIYYRGLMNRAWFNTTPDLIIGAILLLLVFIGTARAFGYTMPIVTLLVISYPFVGTYLPEPFYSTSLGFFRTLSNITVSLSGGLYGVPLAVSAAYLFLFILFGSILNSIGAVKIFYILADIMSTKFRAGTALMSVVSSAGIGSITGSVAANVAVTGSFTIPLMRKAGYTKEQAAGIEAAASNGGKYFPQ
jgi:TRAP-type uncharacterized transport system fused permease subunit